MEEPAPPPETVPAHTTPTWEMELLVSGATIFGLLQLPQLIDHAYFRVMNLSPQDYADLMMPLWVYSKVATISLVVTFVAHLCLRGYWVALVGMDSVYPGGIRWDRLGRGRPPAPGEAPSMASIIEHADNRATRVFATGFGFAMLMVKLTLAVLVLLACCVAVDAMLGPGHTLPVFSTLLALLVLPLAIASALDRRLGARLVDGSPAQRLVARVLGFYRHLGMGRSGNPLLALFISHEGRPRAISAFVLFLLPIMAVLMMQQSLARGRLPMGLFVGLGTENAFSGTASPNAFYADSGMDRAGKLPLPHIAGRVVSGARMELFVPFIPRLHGPAMQAACPRALAQGAGAEGNAARLACLAALTDIRIDGEPAQVRLDASTDAQTDQPGMLAMLPVAALAAGRHELSLSEPGRDSTDSARPGRRYRIPFWK